MFRKNDNENGNSVGQVFTEIVAAVVFFMILFIIVQQLRFIEIFEKERVEKIQTFLEAEVRQAFEKNGMPERTPSFLVDPNSPLIQKITMTDNTLRFDRGKADLQREVDEKIVVMIGEILNENQEVIEALQVEGHTDTLPINTYEFPSNWELSSARAATVVRKITEEASFPAKKISAVGFSQYQPIASSNLDLNRRIEFIIRYNFDKKYISSNRALEIYERIRELEGPEENNSDE